MDREDEFLNYCQFIVDSGPFSGHKAKEHIIQGKQDTVVEIDQYNTVLNFCSNNYSGLASDPRIIEAAERTLKTHGYGMSSAPLMCGFQNLHKELERRIARFHGTEDSILYPSGYHTNVGVFQACFNENDAIFSDRENHASIIDGIRLSKAKKFVYKHLDLEQLEEQLKNAQDYRFKCIVTEGIFSMEADILDLPAYVALAKKYDAMIYLDECHSAGVIGKTGRGCIEYHNVDPKDIHFISSTLGKAIGGGGGGYTTGPKSIIDFLRQVSRTFVFSNSLCSPIIGASLKALDILEEDTTIVQRLQHNSLRFRTKMRQHGFRIWGADDCPICPVWVVNPDIGRPVETKLFEKGFYTIILCSPVVPEGTARMRIIITAKHIDEEIDGLVQAFKEVADDVNLWKEMDENKHIPGVPGNIPEVAYPSTSSVSAPLNMELKSKL